MDQMKTPERREAEKTAEHVSEAAREAGTAAKEKTLGFANQQKRAAAEQMSGLAEALRSTAGQMHAERTESLAGYVEQAAERIERASRSLREEDPGALLERAEDFARRQPTAFLATSVALGFAMARFLKSSAERRHHRPVTV